MSQKSFGDGAVPPRDPRSWQKAATKYEIISIHELESADSASEITVKQFLSLKVLRPRILDIKDLYADKIAGLFGSTETKIRKIRNDMEKQDSAWAAYLSGIKGDGITAARYERSSKFPRELGAYALVLQSQMEVSRMEDSLDDSNKIRLTPYPRRVRPESEKHEVPRRHSQTSGRDSLTSENSSGPASISPMPREEAIKLSIGDEQIVNTAAINFLNALFIHDDRPADWTAHRKQFKFNSKSVRFEARTDGHFQVHGQERSAAILEVKARTRLHDKGFRIEMQESAQMALWIFQEPNSHWGPTAEDDSHQ